MTLQPFKDEELNYFKFASLVLNEFPKALRQTFKSIWDNTFTHLPPWNDSVLVRNLFFSKEGGRTKVPTNLPYEEWDCTALFQATIYARSFALPDSKGHHQTLSNLYVKPHKVAHGKFHAAVVSPSGNRAETFALAIDQLRLLRNTICHSTNSKIDKPKFDQFVQLSKEAFKALGVQTDPLDAIGSLTETDFPTQKVLKLQQALKEEARAYQKFLEGMCSEIDELKEKVESRASKEGLASMGQKIDDLRQEIVQGKQHSGKKLIISG